MATVLMLPDMVPLPVDHLVTPQAWPAGPPARTDGGNFGSKLPPARGSSLW
jgi:hypothetical protein